MDKRDILKKYFPKIEDFHDIQEPTIDALIDSEKVLCLMPTGGGKSLIYQVAGLLLGKTTLVISPLVALMSQQCKQLTRLGIQSVNLTGMGSSGRDNLIRLSIAVHKPSAKQGCEQGCDRTDHRKRYAHQRIGGCDRVNTGLGSGYQKTGTGSMRRTFTTKLDTRGNHTTGAQRQWLSDRLL